MSPTYDQIASDFDLWQEYADTAGAISREEFDAMSHAGRVAMQIEAFGPEPPPVLTVDEVLAKCRTSNGLCRWDSDGGAIDVPEPELRQALEGAFDPLMPSWPALVDLADA